MHVVNSIDCATNVARIAAVHQDQLCIYQPNDSNKWSKSAIIHQQNKINVISFNSDASRILTGGDDIQIWALEESTWKCIWKCRPANKVFHLKYSSDDSLFCSAGELDLAVKIWYESVNLSNSLNFSFIYISHPRPITGLEWRRTCKYMPRGSVANVLSTSCKDNISRIWVQTLLPDDISFMCLDRRNIGEEDASLRSHDQPQRQKLFKKRLHRAFSQFRRKQPLSENNSIRDIEKAVNSSETCAISPTLIKPSLHFHLAATIHVNVDNRDDNAPLIIHWVNNKDIYITRSFEMLLQDMFTRILQDGNTSSNANNSSQSAAESCSETDIDTEEYDDNDDTITAQSGKKLRHKLCHRMNKQRALAASGRKEMPDSTIELSSKNSSISESKNGRTSPTSLVEEFDKTMEQLLKQWQTTTDFLFSIDKSDGTFILWQAMFLDGEDTGVFRNVQIDELSRLKSVVPKYYAITMSANVTAYSPNAYLDLKRAYFVVANATNTFSSSESLDVIASNQSVTLSSNESGSGIFIITHHLSGVLGLWKLGFDANNPKIRSIDLVTRVNGLPIESTWLRDGYLIIEQQDRAVLKWLPITTEPSCSDQPESQIIDRIHASQIAKSLEILPQYHQIQLIELLAFGKLQRVKAILNHLVECLASSEPKNADSLNYKSGKVHRSRTLSIVSQTSPVFTNSFDLDDIEEQVVEQVELDYTEVTSIQPLPLYSLFEADIEKPKPKKEAKIDNFLDSYDSIFNMRSPVEETLDEILGKSTIQTINKQKQQLDNVDDGASTSLIHFDSRKASNLTQLLTHIHLPGLTNIDQVHLLAVADAVALFDASLEDCNSNDDEFTDAATNIAIDSLDDRGLRFLTAMRQHIYLSRSLPINQRNELKSAGIGSHNIVWGFHSESQDELLSLIPCVKRNKPEWAELREFGIGWWPRKLEVLRKLIEKTAQSAYQAKQDPLDAALFYLCMKKKTLVCALLRRVNCDKRLLKLFEQDFSDPVNRRKALKNAYALLGLHRFEHAAAFFLLAGSIWDAVEVCINNLNDIQLAIVLIRLHDSDQNIPDNLKKLLYAEILGSKVDDLSKFSYNPAKANPDSFLRSIAFWKLGDYVSAFETLIETERFSCNKAADTSNAVISSSNSRICGGNSIVGGKGYHQGSVFNFYLYIRDQPLVQRHKQTSVEQESDFKKSNVAEKSRQLLYSEAQAYLDCGCPLLALDVLASEEDKNDHRALRMRFKACLSILLNELATAPNGSQFLEWLEKSSEIVERICNLKDDKELGGLDQREDEDKSLKKNMDWIRRQEPILRTMLTFCNLHCAKESNLITVRQELLNLVDNYQLVV